MLEKKLPPIKFPTLLEACAVVSIAMLFTIQFIEFNSTFLAIISSFAFVVHFIRLTKMKGWLFFDHPLLIMMNIAYAWMVISFLIKALYELGYTTDDIWLHAFTMGAMGSMMISLMLRVTLRHTGRPLNIVGLGKIAFGLLLPATLIRLLSEYLPSDALALSALIFCSSFIIYLCLYTRILYQPSIAKRRKEKRT